MKQSQLNRLIKTITICATLFIVLLVGIIIGQYVKMHQLNSTLEDLKTNIDEYSAQRYTVQNNLENHTTALYIEEYARNELNKIKESEVFFDTK